jgi:hypothetical protein
MSNEFSLFESDLDHFGPDLAVWPVAPRERAQRVLAADPRAMAALEAARVVDAALRAPPGPPASAELRSRILGAAAPRRMAPVRQASPRWIRVAGSAALAASLLLGFFVGAGDPASAAPAEADAISLLLGPNAEDYAL